MEGFRFAKTKKSNGNLIHTSKPM
ncbi:hypothetical protein CCACVL1_09431 [Corchorus capsularis]|uniref:Uncharacterized protein n=1 Tax=Corchorus capsularis TaxID=210143 RepID=A0A1R3IWB0_COCAP|nr:hypothetical protein CCACVL1_09431 [Corchorus capsularis]